MSGHRRNRTGRFGGRIIALCLGLAVAVSGLPAGSDMTGLGVSVFGITPAAAQERQPGLLQRLFNRRAGENRRQATPRRATPAPRQTRSRSTTRRTTRRAPQRSASRPAPAPTIPKNENARRVLVVGDFIANGLASGLSEAFAESANVAIDKQVNGSSGFVRDDHYDWPANIGAILEDKNPDIVVVLIGSNDRQQLRVDGRSRDVLSDEWRAEYTARIDRFVGEIKESGALLVWTGSPPFRFRSMSADILAFNDIYRAAAEGADGYFVDIWDGFVDANGNFIERGSDIKGQTVRLRNSDGINFSRAGQRKLAFYVERQLMQILGDAASPLLTSLGPDAEPAAPVEPEITEAEMVRISAISFLDPELDGGLALLGDVDAQVPTPAPVADPEKEVVKSVRQMLIEDGVPPPAQPGRAGNFQWANEEARLERPVGG